MIEKYSKTDFDSLFNDCICYVVNQENHTMAEVYMMELIDANDWESFISTGVFHDAIGKIVDQTEDSVTVTTEY